MKNVKRLLAVVMILALIATYFVFPASAEVTEKYYLANIAKVQALTGAFGYDKDPFVTLEFLTMAGELVRTGEFGGTFSYSHNGTTIYTFEKINESGRYCGYPNANLTDDYDFVYEISSADKNRNYTGTVLDGKVSSLISADYIMATVSTNPVVDVSEEYVKAYDEDTAVSIPYDFLMSPVVNTDISKDELYGLYKTFISGGHLLLDAACIEPIEDTKTGKTFVVYNNKRLFEMSGTDTSFELILQSDITYEDNISYINDSSLADVVNSAKESLYYNGIYLNTVTFIHGNEYEADDVSWIQGSSEGQSIESNASRDDFKYVKVDGEKVDTSNYTVQANATVVTFTPAYLSTLSIGDHPFVIVSKNGIAEAVLTIEEAPNINDVYYTVTFDTDGKTTVDPQTVKNNECASEPANPYVNRHTFIGWYTDKTYETEFDFETPITADTTVYGRFIEISTEVVCEVSDPEVEIGVEEEPINNVLEKIAQKCAQNSTSVKAVAVKVMVDSNVSQEDKGLIAAKAGEKNFIAYDVSLLLTVNGTETKDIGGENDELINIKYTFDFTDKSNLKTFRVHSGAVDELTETPNANGEFVEYDKDAGTITVTAKKYSTYAFAYDVYEEETTAPVEEETTAPVEEETTAPVEEETTVPVEEETTTPVEEETTVIDEEEIVDTADDTAISTFVALGTLSIVGFVAIKKKED